MKKLALKKDPTVALDDTLELDVKAGVCNFCGEGCSQLSSAYPLEINNKKLVMGSRPPEAIDYRWEWLNVFQGVPKECTFLSGYRIQNYYPGMVIKDNKMKALPVGICVDCIQQLAKLVK
jgi:hypothetical protein